MALNLDHCKYGLLSYTDLPDCSTFHFSVSKKSLNSTTSLIRKGRCLSSWMNTFFQPLIWIWKFEFYHCCHHISDRLTLFIFKKMPMKYPNLNNHSSFEEKQCSMESGSFSLKPSPTSSFKIIIVLPYRHRNALCVFLFPYTEYQKYIFSRDEMLKHKNNSYCLSRILLN